MIKNGYNPEKPFNKQIRSLIEATHPKEGLVTIVPEGKRYRIAKRPEFSRDYDELRASDGIGTKGKFHWKMRSFPAAAQDALAMVVDDLAETNWRPFELQDHIILPVDDDQAKYSLVQSLRDLCLKLGIAISGGETAILDTLDGLEMGISATGMRKKEDRFKTQIYEDAEIIGIKSSGIHSNGITFIRKFMDENGIGLDSNFENGTKWGTELTRPTIIYYPVIKELFENFRESLYGFVHITGGGFAKLKELNPSGQKLDIVITRDHKLKPQQIFHRLYREGKLTDADMYKKFNCGVGYAVAVRRDKAKDIVDAISKYHQAVVIGEAKIGSGRIYINSRFSGERVVF